MEHSHSDRMGVAVVGCGYWGFNYLRILRDLPEVGKLVAIDSRPNRLKEITNRFQGIAAYEDVDGVLEDPAIDAVVICTPASTHDALVEQSLRAGKAVLVEKPIALDVERAEEVISLADDLDLTLAVGHTFLYNPAIDKIKSLIDTGQLGQMYYLYARRTNLGPIREDVNAIWDLATHDISIVHHLLGRLPQWVSAVGSNILGSGRADVGFAVLGYEDDLVAHIHVSWADPSKVREVVVVGSERRVVFDDLKIGEQVRVYEKGVTPLASQDSESFGLDLLIRDGDIISPKIEVSEPLRNQVVDFLECIKTGDRPVSDGRAGLAVVKVLEAIDRSQKLRGAPVNVHVGEPAQVSVDSSSDDR